VTWLLDTCVISELAKPRPATSVAAWIRRCPEDQLFISVITLGELEKGITRLPGSTRRKALEAWVRKDVVERFRGRVLGVDIEIASRWGALSGASEMRGQPLPVLDSLIAATSLQHGLTVVTRNVEDLERCGARCLNPW
jgi:toxin FitB